MEESPHRLTVVLPAEFFSATDRKLAKEGVGVTLVPRHFVFTSPSSVMPWQDHLRGVAPQTTIRCRVGPDESNDYLLLNCPCLLEGIRAAWREGHYAAEYDRIAAWQGKLLVHAASRSGTDQLGWLAQFAKLDAEVKEEEVTLRALLDPSGDPREALAALLENFDADFLLGKFPEQFKGQQDEAVAGWRALVLEVLVDAHSAIARPARPEDARDYVQEALQGFLGSQGRIIRRALENAQRLHLGGREPNSFAAVRVSDLVRQWRGFAAKRLKREASDYENRALYDEFTDATMEVKDGMIRPDSKRSTIHRDG